MTLQQAMTMVTVKEEPVEDDERDELIASFNLVVTNNPKYKVFSVSGLSTALKKAQHYDVSVRTDLKEMKVNTRINGKHSIFYTKETTLGLYKKSFAVRLCNQTNAAYFTPINSLHSISFLDESYKSNKTIDAHNKIYQDCFQMPHPSRNKHDQLCIEMKNYLYKPLRMVEHSELKKFFEELEQSSMRQQKRTS